MPISTVWIVKYVQQCYVKWFWNISSFGAPDVLPISLLILRKTPTVLQSSDGEFFPPISRPPAWSNCVRNLEFWKDFYKFMVSAFIRQNDFETGE